MAVIDDETRGRLIVLAADAITDASIRPVFSDAALEAGWSPRPVRRVLESELGEAYTSNIWPLGFKVRHLFTGERTEVPSATSIIPWKSRDADLRKRPSGLLVAYCWRAIHAVLVCEMWCNTDSVADALARGWAPNSERFEPIEIAPYERIPASLRSQLEELGAMGILPDMEIGIGASSGIAQARLTEEMRARLMRADLARLANPQVSYARGYFRIEGRIFEPSSFERFFEPPPPPGRTRGLAVARFVFRDVSDFEIPDPLRDEIVSLTIGGTQYRGFVTTLSESEGRTTTFEFRGTIAP